MYLIRLLEASKRGREKPSFGPLGVVYAHLGRAKTSRLDSQHRLDVLGLLRDFSGKVGGEGGGRFVGWRVCTILHKAEKYNLVMPVGI